MKPRHFFIVLLSLFSVLTLPNHAAAPDVSGSWKWNFERNGESREIAMKLKQDGSKVSGTITGPDGNQVNIREGKIADDGKLVFFIEIERDGNTMKIIFDGKASADTITGKTTFINSQGEEREREWVAKREARKMDLTGEWKSSTKRQDGTTMESSIRFRQAGDLLTGISRSRSGNEIEIQDGKVQGEEVSFRISREREGRTITTKYRGKVQADGTIKGQIDSDWNGEFRKMDWEAKKVH